MKDKNGIHLIEAIKNITDERVLNDIIKTAENRLTELITKVNTKVGYAQRMRQKKNTVPMTKFS
mgnify:CR=1 FL=1